METTATKTEEHTALLSRGKQGLIGAGVVMSLFLLIVVLSKANDIAKRRLPMMWRMRLRKMVQESINAVKLAKESDDEVERHRNLIAADTYLETAKRLVGTGSLADMAGIDIAKLETDLERELARSTNTLKGLYEA
jgi:hypothetical protein